MRLKPILFCLLALASALALFLWKRAGSETAAPEKPAPAAESRAEPSLAEPLVVQPSPGDQAREAVPAGEEVAAAESIKTHDFRIGSYGNPCFLHGCLGLFPI